MSVSAVTRITLPGHQVQRLAGPMRLRTESGLLWITVDGEPEDILLAAGQSRHFGRHARVIAYALGGDARFELSVEVPAAVAGAPGWVGRLTAWLPGGRPALGGGA